MPTSLLRTKLNIPPARSQLVPRSRLIGRLDRGLHDGRALSLVAAPAGFGKTTLVQSWVSHLDRPVAWVSLDENDNDPVRCLAYVVGAMQTIDPVLGEATQLVLQSTQSPSVEAVLTELINEIAAVGEPLVLVLDDYHVIETDAIHDSIAFLLEHRPPQMHLVLVTRVDPPLPLARLRARNQITELRAADLRFTVEEARNFLTEVMGLDLSADDIATLEARTEGWIAGLQLAALSMQGHDDPSGFVDAFAGDDRYVLDYLIEEVIRRQPEHVRTFLLETSVLERLSGPLCDAVTGRDDGQTLLEDLDAANLFLVPLDSTRTWYRYHTLFRDFLRRRLGEEFGRSEIAALHLRASTWYEVADATDEAVQHALAADAFDRAAQLIERVAETMTWGRGDFPTFLRWLDALPDDVIFERSRLALHYAYALADGTQLDAADAILREVERRIDEETQDELHGIVAGIRSYVVRFRGETTRSIDLAHRALDLLPERATFWRSTVTLHLGGIYYADGDVVRAERTLRQARALQASAGNVAGVLITVYLLGQLEKRQADLPAAQALYEEALHVAREHARGSRLVPQAGAAYVGLGDLYREWNDLEVAAEHLTEGLALGERIGNIGTLSTGYASLAQVRYAQGDLDAARELLDRLHTFRRALQHDTNWTDAELGAVEARLHLMVGDLAAARRWAAAATRESAFQIVNEGRVMMRARIHIAEARETGGDTSLDRTLDALQALMPAAKAAGRLENFLEMLMLQALALQARSAIDAAVQALAEALTVAEPSRYVRLFVDEGAPMAELLIATLRAERVGTVSVPADYAGDLLSAFDDEVLPPPVVETRRTSGRALIEPLTERELEVLALMAAGLTNRAIANRLHITVGTVKTHAKSIYGKLDVHNRTEAAARARELGLL